MCRCLCFDICAVSQTNWFWFGCVVFGFVWGWLFFFCVPSFSLWLNVLWHLSAWSSTISRAGQNLTFKNVSPIKDLPYQVLKYKVVVLGAHLQLLWKEKGAISWQCPECPTFRFPPGMLVLTRPNDVWSCKICRLGFGFGFFSLGVGSIQSVTQTSHDLLHFIFNRLLWCPLLSRFLVIEALIWDVGKAVSETELSWKDSKSELPPFSRDLGWVAFGILAFL